MGQIVESSFKNEAVLCSGPAAVIEPSDFASPWSKEFVDIQATMEGGFILKRVLDMTRTQGQLIMLLLNA